MRLRFDRLKPYVIAIDGQPTDTFEPLRSSLPFAPGTRYDVIVDLPDEAGASGAVTAAIGDGMPLVELVAAGEKTPARATDSAPSAEPEAPGARSGFRTLAARICVIKAAPREPRCPGRSTARPGIRRCRSSK